MQSCDQYSPGSLDRFTCHLQCWKLKHSPSVPPHCRGPGLGFLLLGYSLWVCWTLRLLSSCHHGVCPGLLEWSRLTPSQICCGANPPISISRASTLFLKEISLWLLFHHLLDEQPWLLVPYSQVDASPPLFGSLVTQRMCDSRSSSLRHQRRAPSPSLRPWSSPTCGHNVFL